MSDIKFKRHENKAAYTLQFGEHDIYLSYETIVAYRGPLGRFRTASRFSQTTDRHISKVFAMTRDHYKIEQDQLEALVKRAVTMWALGEVYDRVGAKQDVPGTLNEAFGPMPVGELVTDA